VDRLERLSWDRLWDSPVYHQLLGALTFAPDLVRVAEEFRRAHLDDEPYLAAHIRATDFKYHHPGSVLTIPQYAARLKEAMEARALRRVFIATNMVKEELVQLRALLDVVTFTSRQQTVLRRMHVGQVATVDQILCTSAAHFIGTEHSFFTNTIHDEIARAQGKRKLDKEEKRFFSQ
jgi:hypothetical protein